MSLLSERVLEIRNLKVLDFLEARTKEYPLTMGRAYEEYVIEYKFNFSYKTFERIICELAERGLITVTHKNTQGNYAYLKFKRKATHVHEVLKP